RAAFGTKMQHYAAPIFHSASSCRAWHFIWGFTFGRGRKTSEPRRRRDQLCANALPPLEYRLTLTMY
ncbi:MAG: hypothetical protein WB048_12775, partial [Pseudolabrys sp.]